MAQYAILLTIVIIVVANVLDVSADVLVMDMADLGPHHLQLPIKLV
jgi:hypothetical protein